MKILSILFILIFSLCQASAVDREGANLSQEGVILSDNGSHLSSDTGAPTHSAVQGDFYFRVDDATLWRYNGSWVQFPEVVDHGALQGLGDDDHLQYLTEGRHDALPADNPHAVTFSQASTADPLTDITANEAENLTNFTNADALHIHDHGNTTGLADDDHLQYLTEGRHDSLPFDNPHSVSFTQAVAADPGTNISAAEAEQLTNGSNSDSLHLHDHGNLQGLGDDDHPQYTRKDTLTTKGDIYVRDGTNPNRLGVGANTQRLEADSTTLTGIKWVDDNFGRDTARVTRTDTFTVTGSTFTNYTTLNFNVADLSGTNEYRIQATYQWSHNSASNDARFQLFVNGVSVTEHRAEPKDAGADQRYSATFLHYATNLATGANTVEIRFRPATSSRITRMHRATIEVWRTQ